MKKIFLSIIVFCLLSIIFIPVLVKADSIVPQDCGYTKFNEDGKCIENCKPCGIEDFFGMLINIYDFIVKMIAAPLAIIALTIGAIFMMMSAGNPNLFGTGKKIVYAAIIGLVLVFCSWLIIDFVLKDLLGFTGDWTNPFPN